MDVNGSEKFVQVKLIDLFHRFSKNDYTFSIELCPNRPLDMEQLKELSPSFCSVIWKNQSDAALQEISKLPAIILTKQLIASGFQVVFHFAGRYLSSLQAKNVLDELQNMNVRNILALRGERTAHLEDKPDFPHASDLIEFIKLNYNDHFCIGVASYIDAHPDLIKKEEEFKYLKLKANLGADFIITQMIFDFESFIKFARNCNTFNINPKIFPGIYIIDSYEDLMKMTNYCRVKVPQNVIKSIDDNKDSLEGLHKFGVFHCGNLIKDMFNQEEIHLNCVHFFSLNNVKLVREVCKMIGLSN